MGNGFSLPYSPPPDQYPEFRTNYQFVKLKGAPHEIEILLSL
jgi:hypothetical protein